MYKWISRTLLFSLVMGAGGVLAFGPRPISKAPAGRVRVQYWEKWTGLEAIQAQQIVDEFNNTVGREKNIWVDFNSMSQIDRKTIISTAAGAPPDVVGLWDGQVQQFAALGALEPLDPYLSQYGIKREQYKPVYVKGCQADGTMYAVPSTVWCVALLWNKQIFADHADDLRAAGCDPDSPPRTITELDRYAAALNTWQTIGHQRRMATAGFIPAEPGSFTNMYGFWFGAHFVNAAGTQLELNSPAMMNTYDWLRGYSERLGLNEMADFRSGFSNGTQSISDTPQNPFLVGTIAMESQGTWISALIEKLRPEGMRWKVPPDELERERNFPRIVLGMSQRDVERILGAGEMHAQLEQWAAGIKKITVEYSGHNVVSAAATMIPSKDRKKYCMWGVSAFPSAVPGKENVTYAGMDVWAVPSTAKHKEEAFEFIAFASQQAQIEHLAMMHCNLSPLIHQSQTYLQNHPNPYIDVFERLAASPNAHPLPPAINWTNVTDELTQVADRCGLLLGSTRSILDNAQSRAQRDLDSSLSDNRASQ